MIVAIVACEVAFWVLLGCGLLARYVLRARALSTALLIAVPLVDVVLLGISVADLRGGGTPHAAHGLAAIYIGASLAFGHQMINWVDQRFAHKFAGGPPPVRPPRTGRAHAARERRQWLRHLLAYVIAAGVLGVFTVLVGDVTRTLPLWAPMAPWGIAVVVDFIVSFSYTLQPRRAE
jgi:2TM domain-containing protein